MMTMSHMYSDSEHVNEWPFLGDKKRYYPAIPVTLSKEYTVIKYDFHRERRQFAINEVMFSLNQFSMQDSSLDLRNSYRTEEFINVGDMRIVHDHAGTYTFSNSH